jgi:putative DNA primase/helicase
VTQSTESGSGPPLYPKPIPKEQVRTYSRENELGDAKLFAAMAQGQLVFDVPEHAWYAWTGNVWRLADQARVRQLISEHTSAAYINASNQFRKSTANEDGAEEPTGVAKTLRDRANRLCGLTRARNVLGFSESILGTDRGEWDNRPWLLPVANGVVDLRTGVLRDGNPNDYLRKASPTTWDGLDAKAPRFEQFLSEVFVGHDDAASVVAFVQRLFGYGITGLSTEHTLPLLWGPAGRNGKDTLLEALHSVLGELAGPVSKDVLVGQKHAPGAPQPHLYQLWGKRLVWASETNDGERLNTGQVKYITGGGTISTRPLHGNMVTFSPTHLLLLLTNHLPDAGTDEQALWDRLIVVPFLQRFVDNPQADNEHKVDRGLGVIFRAEAPGILAWLVRGCLDWQARRGLDIPDPLRQYTSQYRRNQDPLQRFINECCEIDTRSVTMASDLYGTYSDWLTETSVGKTRLSVKKFGLQIKLLLDSGRNSAGVYYQGVKIRPEWESDGISEPINMDTFRALRAA